MDEIKPTLEDDWVVFDNPDSNCSKSPFITTMFEVEIQNTYWLLHDDVPYIFVGSTSIRNGALHGAEN